MTEKAPSDPKNESIRVQKSGIIAIVVALLLVALAVGAWWMNNSQSIEDLTPEEATDRMIEQIGQLDSYQFAADVELDPILTAAALTELEGIQEVTDAMGITNPNDIVVRMNGAVDMRGDREDASLTVELGLKNDEEESVVAVDMITTEGPTQYFRVQLPDSLTKRAKEELDGFDLSFATNQWISVDLESVVEQLGLQEALAAEGLESDPFPEPYTGEEYDRALAVLSENMPLPLTEKLETENIAGVDSIKYRAELDVDMLQPFVVDMLKLQREIYEERGVSQEQLEQIDQSIALFEDEFDTSEISQVFEENAQVDFFVWLDSKNGMPTQMQMSVAVKEALNVGLTMTLTLSEHNQPQDITVPEDTMSAQAFLGEFALRAAGTELEGFADDFQQGFEEGFNQSLEEPEPKKEQKNKKDKKK